MERNAAADYADDADFGGYRRMAGRCGCGMEGNAAADYADYADDAD